MNILIIGSGGREHTFAWKLSQSNKCSNLYIAPGNAGTEGIATNIDVSVGDFEGIKSTSSKVRPILILSSNISILLNLDSD